MSVSALISLADRAYRSVFRPPASDVEEVLLRDRAPTEPCSALDPWIGSAGDFSAPAAARLRQALHRAQNEPSPLPAWIAAMEGMSGPKYRALINHLLAMTMDARYLEIGSWKGSSACAAMAGNAAKITCIDNWSEFGGPRAAFLENVHRCLTPQIDFALLEQDYRTIDFRDLGPFNLYLFDGPHGEDDHHQAICKACPALDDTFTLIIDDWNWKQVRKGTKRALREMRLNVLALIEIRTSSDDTYGNPDGRADWHNGYFLAVCRKEGSPASPAPAAPR